MDLNERKETEISIDKSDNKNDMIELSNNIYPENITNISNINQSYGSIKTTEYSFESGELISKYIIDNLKNNQKNKNNIDEFKKNLLNNININNDVKKEKCKNQKNLIHKKKLKALKIEEYKSEYLTKNANINSPKIPINYNIDFNIDDFTYQVELGENEYIKKNNNNKSNNNEEYKIITNIPHDKLSHIFINNNLYKKKIRNNYNKKSVTQRIKHKLLTLIYFSPKK